MKQLFFLLTLTFFSWAVKAQTKLDDAKKLITNENYTGAKKMLEAFVAEGTGLPRDIGEAYYWLGETDYRNLIESNPAGAMAAARQQYEKGLTVVKDNPYSLVGMGKLLLDAKNTKEAAKTFDQAIRASRSRRYKEGNPDVYDLIGDSYLKGLNKDPEQAVANYTRSRDIDPTPASTWLRLGDGSMAKGDAGAAMSAYGTASSKDKTNAEVYEKMALIWRKANKLDLAIDTAIAGTKVNPQYAPNFKLLAQLYSEAGKYNKVAPALDNYLKLVGDQDPEARLRFFKYLTYSVKDYDRVIKEGEDFATKFGEKYPSIYRWLAWSYVEKAVLVEKENNKLTPPDTLKIPIIQDLYTKGNTASQKLMKAYEATPTYVQDYDFDYRARSASKIGKLDEALSMYQEELKLDSTKTCVVYTGLMQLYYGVKDFKKGLDMLDQKNGKCDTKTLEIFYAMYYSYYSKQSDRGIGYADKYIALKPAGTDGYNYKGLCQEQLDTTANPTFKAKDTYEMLVKNFEATTDTVEIKRVKTNAVHAYNYLALAYAAANDFIKAKDMSNKAIVLDPADTTALSIIEQIKASGH